MSCKKVINFAVQFVGDGTDDLAVSFAIDPVFVGPAPLTGVVLQPGFGLSASKPDAVSALSVNGGLTIESSALLLGVLTVDFTGDTVEGTLYTLQGTLNYN